ncbi:MAG: anthranilate synthase component family protein, partial [Nocardioidaceae bacterium]|nr:anthranilate synthase component family protein [Nocardioidaceae bacterium]
DGVPDAVWMRVRRPRFVTHPAVPVGSPAPRPAATDPPPSYVRAFERVQEHLHAGNSYEVNLTYRDRVRSDIDPETAYLRLRAASPAPYAGYLRHGWRDGDVHLLSSSPERYASIDRERTLVARPIKGTTPRGATPEEDERLRRLLTEDPKLRAENLMITDLLRNDLALVCDVGTVEVPGLMEVESYASVHQLVTTVRGRLRPEVGSVDAVRALFPAGSMTGAPKRRTMEVIDEVEADPRGVYAGAFGWLSADGRADLGVVIRSLVAVPRAGRWDYTLGTGGGITVRSDLLEEWRETTWKAERLRAVL